MQNLNFLIKPASSQCNMRCRYCFYADEAAVRCGQSAAGMTRPEAETLIRSAFAAAEPGAQVSFSFQGGEPTLAGLDFFRFFMAKAAELRPARVHINYALQTNGLVLNDEWAEFLAANQVLVGISLDGTKELHDNTRLDAKGKGTWNRVTAALHVLQKHDVEVNLLCVVNRAVARSPQKVYASLKKLGVRHLQFIACLDPIEGERGAQPWALTPETYGKFLCGLFDVYYRDWVNGDYTSVRLFDDYIHMAMGMPAGTCATSGSCGAYFVVEGDGTVYPCDFYCLDEWKMGRIGEQSIPELANSEKACLFLQQGERKPDACADCRWYSLCHGGCKRDWVENDGKLENYSCLAFKEFFAYAESRILEIARAEAEYYRR